MIDASKVLTVATSVKDEQDEVQHLKSVLGTQGTLRPIFEGQLKQKRAIREHAIGLRKLVAEAGFNYQDLEDLYKKEDELKRSETIKSRIEEASDKDLEELIKLLDKHFLKSSQTEIENKPSN